MKEFISNQLEKEKKAAQKVGRAYLKIWRVYIIFFCGLFGLSALFTSAWFVGILLLAAAWYVWQRTK